MKRAEPFDILQVEAKKKGHGERGAIIDQSRQVREYKNRIMAKPCDIKKRILDIPFSEDEGNHQCKANQDKPDPKCLRQGRKPIHDCRNCSHVKEGTAIIEMFISRFSRVSPLPPDFPQDEDKDRCTQGNVDQEYTPPAKMLGQEST